MNGNADGRVSLAISRRLSGNQCEESLINPYCPAPLTFFYVYTLPAVLSTGVLMAFSRTFSLLPVTHVTGVWLFTSVTTVQSTLFFQQFTVVWSGHGVSFLFNNRLSNLLSAPLACSCVLAHESTRTRVSTYIHILMSILIPFFVFCEISWSQTPLRTVILLFTRLVCIDSLIQTGWTRRLRSTRCVLLPTQQFPSLFSTTISMKLLNFSPLNILQYHQMQNTYNFIHLVRMFTVLCYPPILFYLPITLVTMLRYCLRPDPLRFGGNAAARLVMTE